MNVMLLILFVVSAVYGGQSSTLLSSDINVSEGCRVAVQRLSTLQATEPQLMARYWDSWGKPSDSILTGHTTFLGYYDECINLKNTDLGDMKYCIYPMIMDTNIGQRSSEIEGDVCHSSNCSMPVNTSTKLNVKVGVCYPSACSADEFTAVLTTMNIKSTTTIMNNPTNAIITSLDVTEDSRPFCPVTDEEYDAGTIAVIVVCVILVGLVVIGTSLDILLWILPVSNVAVISEPDSKLSNSIPKSKDSSKKNLSDTTKAVNNNSPTAKDFILAFSLYNNVSNILAEQSPSAIKALSAIKIISNFIIISSHVFQLVGLFYPGTSQNLYLHDLPSRLIFQPIINVTLAVETFFVVSGTLSAYLTFKDMEKHKRFRFKYFYLNRFFRLSPLLYFHTLIVYKLSTILGQGPLWYSPDANACANTWWCNLLYLTNTGPVLDMCNVWTWHISADMQMFVISPIFIILLYHIQYVGLAAVAIAMIAATATIGYVSATNGYWAAIFYNPQILDQLTGLHVQVFYRINSYLTGILLGYILYNKYNLTTLPVANYSKHVIYALLWVVGITLCLVTLFGPYGEYSFAHHFSDMENVIYLMFSGLAWSIGIAIIIYICNTGYGGVMNNFFSLSGWEPLVKLSYGVALYNPLVLFYILGTLQSSLKYTDAVFAMIALFTVVLSYLVSFITAVCVEQPMVNIVAICFKLARIKTRSK